MKATITLEPDLARSVEALANRWGLSFEQTLDEVVRRGLLLLPGDDVQTRYTLQPHPSGFRLELPEPEIDTDKPNQIFDQLEIEAFVAKVRRENECRAKVPTPQVESAQ